MKKILSFVFIALITFNVNAQQTASKQSVETLMELTEVSKMVDTIYSQITNMFNGMSDQLGISKEEKPAFDKYMNELTILLKEDMGWDKFKGPIIDIYAKRLTETEVQGLIKFYRSDAGKSMIKKMPLIMQDSMLVSQEVMKEFLPKVKILATQMQSEIKELRKKKNEK